jgi:hypothetical protein
MRRQESEIQEIKLFNLEDVPEPLAFVHSSMVRDYVVQKASGSKK